MRWCGMVSNLYRSLRRRDQNKILTIKHQRVVLAVAPSKSSKNGYVVCGWTLVMRQMLPDRCI